MLPDTDLVFYFDDDDLEDGAVSYWEERRGTGENFIQNTSSAQPTKTSDGVYFDGNDWMTAGSVGFSIGSSISLVVIAKFVEVISRAGVLCGLHDGVKNITLSNRNTGSAGFTHATVYYHHGSGTMYFDRRLSDELDKLICIIVTADQTNGVKMYIDGVQVTAHTSYLGIGQDGNSLTLGTYGAGYDALVAGSVVRLVAIYDRELTQQDVDDIMASSTIQTKLGLSSGGDVDIEDTATGTELISIEKTLLIDDNASVEDIFLRDKLFELAETTEVTDSLTRDKNFAIIDDGAGIEFNQLNKQLTVIDSADGLDTISIDKLIVIAEAGFGGDDLPIGKLLLINDQAEGSDEILITGSSHNIIADFGEGSDSILVSKNIFVNDSAEGNDVIVRDKSIFIVDTAEGTEQVLIGKAFFISDTGQGSDAANVDAEMQRLIEDYGIGTDEIKVNKNFVINEAGTGTDLLVMIKDILVQDASEGSDNILMGKALLIIDFGQSAETVSIIAGERFFSILRLDSAITMQQMLLSSIFTQQIIISQIQKELILNSKVKLK